MRHHVVITMCLGVSLFMHAMDLIPQYLLSFQRKRLTPLMKAVRDNKYDLVSDLLRIGMLVNLSSSKNRFVRDFNMIYSREKIGPLIVSIVNRMLMIETHNALSPDDQKDCYQELYRLKASQSIRHALFIDKMLYDHRAYSDISDDRHPVLRMLKDVRVRRALSYILRNHIAHIPHNVRYRLLCRHKTPKVASVPGLFYLL